MKSCSLVGCGLLILFLMPLSAHAVALVTFNFNDQNLIPDGNAGHVSVSSITPGSGTTFGYALDSAGDYSLSTTNWGTGSFSAAITANDYFTFSIAPQTGYYLDLASVSVSALGGTGNRRIQLQYSFNNGASYQTAFTTGNLGSSWQTINGTLNDQVLNRTMSTVLFRVSGYTGSNTRTIRFDDIVVYGNVNAVPAPGAAALLATGLGLNVWRKWRRRKSNIVQAS